jgi:hypothetical protein
MFDTRITQTPQRKKRWGGRRRCGNKKLPGRRGVLLGRSEAQVLLMNLFSKPDLFFLCGGKQGKQRKQKMNTSAG